jgi:hypothetical protein
MLLNCSIRVNRTTAKPIGFDESGGNNLAASLPVLLWPTAPGSVDRNTTRISAGVAR